MLRAYCKKVPILHIHFSVLKADYKLELKCQGTREPGFYEVCIGCERVFESFHGLHKGFIGVQGFIWAILQMITIPGVVICLTTAIGMLTRSTWLCK